LCTNRPKKVSFVRLLLPFTLVLPSQSALFTLTVHPCALEFPSLARLLGRGCTIVYGLAGGEGGRFLRMARSPGRVRVLMYSSTLQPEHAQASAPCIKNRRAPRERMRTDGRTQKRPAGLHRRPKAWNGAQLSKNYAGLGNLRKPAHKIFPVFRPPVKATRRGDNQA
jgi:hypothetical protein